MRLFTIGDSISQGFMSAAAARTEDCYSTLVARKLGLVDQVDYRYPVWEQGGLPANLEAVLRRLQQRFGSNINALEWATVALPAINGVLDQAEDYYERGPGRPELRSPDGFSSYHNISVFGYDIADSWLVTPELCRRAVGFSGSGFFDDAFLAGPDNAFYRTALRVLNPSNDPAFERFSALKWLEHHAEKEGVENVFLWLGANNALGTVLDLKVRQTPGDPNVPIATFSRAEREKMDRNLWHISDFEDEYGRMLNGVEKALARNADPSCRVFLGTVPLVTIAPLAKGVGETAVFKIEDVDEHGKATGKFHDELYYKYYTYFPFEEQFARTSQTRLTMDLAKGIDDTIRSYNAYIKREVAKRNKRANAPCKYVVVDLAETLRSIAIKRNQGQPEYEYPDFFKTRVPKPNTKFYHADRDGTLLQGGIFTLDGVHPGPIAHGLIALEFLKAMKANGVKTAAGAALPTDFTDDEWRRIVSRDTLFTDPIRIMQEVYEYPSLTQYLLKVVQHMNVI